MKISQSYLKDLLSQVHKGEISFSRMVEMINEVILAERNRAIDEALRCASQTAVSLHNTAYSDNFVKNEILALKQGIIKNLEG